MAKYALQMKEHRTEKWVTLSEPFDTLEQAKAALAERRPQSLYRIAEAYTVVRYKPVKV